MQLQQYQCIDLDHRYGCSVEDYALPCAPLSSGSHGDGIGGLVMLPSHSTPSSTPTPSTESRSLFLPPAFQHLSDVVDHPHSHLPYYPSFHSISSSSLAPHTMGQSPIAAASHSHTPVFNHTPSMYDVEWRRLDRVQERPVVLYHFQQHSSLSASLASEPIHPHHAAKHPELFINGVEWRHGVTEVPNPMWNAPGLSMSRSSISSMEGESADLRSHRQLLSVTGGAPPA